MPIEVVCWNCRKTIEKKPRSVRNNSRHFCDNNCKHEYFRENGREIMGEQERLIK